MVYVIAMKKLTSCRIFSLVFALVSVFGLALFFVGCSTDLNPGNSLTPEQHLAAGEKNLELARGAAGNQAIEYRLMAAEHFIKADNKDNAGQALREIQSGEAATEDMDIRNRVLEARLALLKDDNKRALSLLQTMITMVAPAKEQLPNNATPAVPNAKGKRIALLLPSKGPHAEAAKTIKEGFLAAFYQVQAQSAEPTVKFYDTQDGSQVEAAYRQAVEDKVDLIVGPLTKKEVETIAGMPRDIPVLALNTIGEGRGANKLYQFGLMPEDEIFAVAAHARQQGHEKALVIAPKTEWGQRMVNTFTSAWSSSGGKVVSTVALSGNTQELDAIIQSALQVNKQSKGKDLSRREEQSRRQKQSRRQDIDMIFMAASPELARQIKPLLNFYHASSLPVYATSAVYSGTPVPGKDLDLDGICFCDMPWILNNTQPLQESHQNLSKAWSNQGSPRYFALGMDAYHLAQQLSVAQYLPPSGTNGATGDLRLENNRIQRRLSCAKFKQGVPVPD